MSGTPDEQPPRPLVNHLVLGALGRAFAKVGQNREIEDWQQLGTDLAAKADALGSKLIPAAPDTPLPAE